MLTLDRLARCSVGVQLGADWVVVVVVDARGAVVARTRARGARSRDPLDVVASVAEHVEVLLRAADVDRSAVVGIGLAVSGAIDLDEGAVLVSRTLERWQGFPVRSALAQATGLPVVLDNDATAAAIGEFWSGRIPGSTAHCTVYMGASIGAGIVVAGSVYRGRARTPVRWAACTCTATAGRRVRPWRTWPHRGPWRRGRGRRWRPGGPRSRS
ncbi:ROK family protein [Cellulomonas soli]